MQMRTAIGHHEIDRFPFLDCEFAHGCQVFAGRAVLWSEALPDQVRRSPGFRPALRVTQGTVVP